ncbi:MAG: MmgE/PrpD family protein, partial [Anaerolineae bacterium]|nr:MmgE/PrpD family protein [Anaerolineae bacterium]
MNEETRIAEFVAMVRWDDLPDPVRWKARMALVDNLGATLPGTLTHVSQIAADWAATAWPGDASTILLHAKKASPAGAAFANGCAANGVDIDDSARYAYGHAGAQLFPAALALAEALGLGGERLLAALVAGYEVAHRIGHCWHDHHAVYQACGSWGSVACAAVAANLLGLTPEQARHALGIAEYHSPNAPMIRDVDAPGMVKHAIGWAAMSGIIAAQLAARGFTGIPTLLSFDQYQEWAGGIGEDYLMVDGVAWKAQGYACCGWAHAAVEGAQRLAREHAICPEMISRIRVEVFEEATHLGTRLPTTTEEAQFNMAWPIAAILVDGEVGPGQTLERRLDDPHIRSLARKVEVEESEELNELCRLFEKGDPRGRFASKVTFVLEDGRTLHSGLVDGGLRFP